MNINDVIALARAGYTRDEIAALAKSAAPEQEPQPAPEQQPQPAPEQQPVQQSVQQTVQQEQPAYDFLSLLSEKIDGLSSAIKASNILNSQMPEVKRETAQDALASIIIPTYNKKEV